MAETMIPDVDETELVIRAQKGDRNAYSELVSLHSRGVLNVIYRMCGDAQLAEDAAQETFIRAWSHLGSFRTEASLRNWLYRIALNTATDMLRREKHILPGAMDDLQLVDPGLSPEGLFIEQEQTNLVQQAIRSLPDSSRQVLVLKEYEGLSYREIADALEIPIGTVMSRLNYARGFLREKLEGKLAMFKEVERV